MGKKHKRQKARKPVRAAAPVAVAVEAVPQAAPAAKGRRVQLHERGAHDDIAYRGPLSYRAFMVLGWICMVLAQTALLCTAASKVQTDQMEHFARLGNILTYVGAMAMPFLLLSNFATMLNHKQSYGMQLLKNLVLMLAVVAVFYMVIMHYVIGGMALLDSNEDRIWKFLENVFYAVVGDGFVAFNMFVDLFLSSLFLFFMFCRPRKIFTGKWVILLRLCALLPIAYELYCMGIKWLCARRLYFIHIAFFPFLPVKPPMTFLVFVLLATFVKIRERHFLKNGKTYEEYQAFLDTNRNSLHFAICAAVLMFFAGIADYLIFMDIADFEITLLGGMKNISESTVFGAYAMGFGKSVALTLLSPLVLLFSYTRSHENKVIDILIPVAGVAFIVLVYIQGLFQFLHIVQLPKLNLDEVTKSLRDLDSMLSTLGGS